jgi:rhodanese-related sulfurtransferase
LRPKEALAAQRAGAVLVDIRPAALREVTGIIPGSLVVERNVLEWRFDPASDARLPVAGRYDLAIVVYCAEGYTSSLAAAALQDLGLHRATDLDGGIAAWRATGLPLVPEL